jgi:hypothetical protein
MINTTLGKTEQATQIIPLPVLQRICRPEPINGTGQVIRRYNS